MSKTTCAWDKNHSHARAHQDSHLLDTDYNLSCAMDGIVDARLHGVPPEISVIVRTVVLVLSATVLLILLQQFANPLVYMLIGAAGVKAYFKLV